MAMNITYYDQSTGVRRVKRRYKWAGYAFTTGIVMGLIIGHMF